MKKLILFYLLATMGFVACKKDDNNDNSNKKNNNQPGPVPSAFTQKVLIEEFTGTWCGWCPAGAEKLEQIIATNPEKVVGVSVHAGDKLQIDYCKSLIANFFKALYFPSGIVSRVAYKDTIVRFWTDWDIIVREQLAKTATCGLAIESFISGNTATVKVHLGTNTTLIGDYKLTILLIEDNVTGYPQKNYLSQNSNYKESIYYNQPEEINDFKHQHVLRKVLTADLGDEISASIIAPGKEGIFEKKVDVTGYNKDELKVVAFIHKAGPSVNNSEVVNVQEAKLGTTKNWD